MTEARPIRLLPALALAVSVAVIVALLWRAALPGESGPLWFLLAIPALVVARLAGARLRRP